MINIIAAGGRGKTGSAVCAGISSGGEFAVSAQLGRKDDAAQVFASVKASVLVDFTCAEAAKKLIPLALQSGLHVVSGTTGMSSDDFENIRKKTEETGKNAIIAPNFSIGACLMMRFAVEASRFFSDYSIVELHHASKKDRPSGTAKQTSRLISGQVLEERIHSIRLPGLVAHQEVIFGGPGQTLTIRHDSMSRDSFVPGVILALRKVSSTPGLTIGIEGLLFTGDLLG